MNNGSWKPDYQQGFDDGVAAQESVHGYALDDCMETIARLEGAQASAAPAPSAGVGAAVLNGFAGGATGALIGAFFNGGERRARHVERVDYVAENMHLRVLCSCVLLEEECAQTRRLEAENERLRKDKAVSAAKEIGKEVAVNYVLSQWQENARRLEAENALLRETNAVLKEIVAIVERIADLRVQLKDAEITNLRAQLED